MPIKLQQPATFWQAKVSASVSPVMVVASQDPFILNESAPVPEKLPEKTKDQVTTKDDQLQELSARLQKMEQTNTLMLQTLFAMANMGASISELNKLLGRGLPGLSVVKESVNLE